MVAIVVPQLDANSESARLVRWEVHDGVEVRRGDPLCTVETSKAVYEVEAEGDGLVVQLCAEGEDVPFNVPIGYVVVDMDEAATVRSMPATDEGAESQGDISATRKARELASRYGIDPGAIGVEGIVTEFDVLDYLKSHGHLHEDRPAPGVVPGAMRKVVVIGAGYGAMQVIDILLHRSDVMVVGCLDDDTALAGIDIFGHPVLGGTDKLASLFRSGLADHAIIAISTSIMARRKFYDECASLGLPMVNAIDPTVRINRGSVIGQGNIICSGSHIGVAARIGDNNFISAHNSIDHHNHWGSHITTGPAVATSGAVTVGDGVKFGTGIYVQPNLSIGADSTIASGAVIIADVPGHSIVRTRIQTEIRAK